MRTKSKELDDRYFKMLTDLYNLSDRNFISAAKIPALLAEYKLSRAICRLVRDRYFIYNKNEKTICWKNRNAPSIQDGCIIHDMANESARSWQRGNIKEPNREQKAILLCDASLPEIITELTIRGYTGSINPVQPKPILF